jgi:hypothetical protein
LVGWLVALFSELTTQVMREYLILVPETDDGLRTTISALWTLGESEGMRFHNF